MFIFHCTFDLDLSLHSFSIDHTSLLSMCFTRINTESIQDTNYHLKEFHLHTDFSDNCDYVDENDVHEIEIKDNALVVIQLNIKGLFGKQDQLLKFINQCNKRKIYIIILAETWLNQSTNKQISVPGYNYVGQARPNKKGGGEY